MAVSERVKLCLTKIAILFTCAGSQVDLGRGKRHLSVEYTHHQKIDKKSPFLLDFSCPEHPNKCPKNYPRILTCYPLDVGSPGPFCSLSGAPCSHPIDRASVVSSVKWQRP